MCFNAIGLKLNHIRSIAMGLDDRRGKDKNKETCNLPSQRGYENKPYKPSKPKPNPLGKVISDTKNKVDNILRK